MGVNYIFNVQYLILKFKLNDIYQKIDTKFVKIYLYWGNNHTNVLCRRLWNVYNVYACLSSNPQYSRQAFKYVDDESSKVFYLLF